MTKSIKAYLAAIAATALLPVACASAGDQDQGLRIDYSTIALKDDIGARDVYRGAKQDATEICVEQGLAGRKGQTADDCVSDIMDQVERAIDRPIYSAAHRRESRR